MEGDFTMKTKLFLIISLLTVLLLASSAFADITVTNEEHLTFEVDFADLEDNDESLSFTHSLTLENTGTIDEDLTLTISGEESEYTVDLASGSDAFTLVAGTTATIDIEIEVEVEDQDIDSGNHTGVFTLDIASSTGTTSFDLNADVQNMIDLESIFFFVNGNEEGEMDEGDSNDGDDDFKAAPGDLIEISFDMTNRFDNDYDHADLEIEVELELDDNDFGDDVDESTSFVLEGGDDTDKGDRGDRVLSFTVPVDADEQDYEMDIRIEAEDENGGKHIYEWVAQLEIEREREDLRIDEVTLSPSSLACGQSSTLTVEVRNYGSDEQDDVIVTVFGSELDLNDNFQTSLGEGGDRDDDNVRTSFLVNVPEDIDAGDYEIEVSAYYEEDILGDREFVDLTVSSCASASSSSDADDTESDTSVEVITLGTGSDDDVDDTTTESTTEETSAEADESTVETVEKKYSGQEVATALILVLIGLVALAVVLLIILGLKLGNRR